MIVNTAYIYMGSGGAPVNPNLWQDGVSNYPVEFAKGSTISSDGLHLPYAGGAATFSELQLTDFNSLTLSATITAFAKVSIDIEFYDVSGSLIGTEIAQFSKSGGTTTVNIPSSAKIQNAKIKILDNNMVYEVTINSALLS